MGYSHSCSPDPSRFAKSGNAAHKQGGNTFWPPFQFEFTEISSGVIVSFST